ncbi:hypothetical protein CPC16_000247 [Podila verticillata]|nr:hypothetical protein BGZ52_004108 [Haplosporangium bisporale]KAF9215232.1 hypothetical protein BGZ59_001927 [Podila verticillata]KAF9394065.1 hypothetical protein CPC16_000247 [Podila verticillata]
MSGGYIGSKISLISRSDIRYVGILHHLNPQDSTVALEQVKSYGTEGRRGNPAEEIPPSDNVFEYIVFRGSDVKDLHVCEPPAPPQPPVRPQVPDDPAILGTTAPPNYYNQHQAPGYYQPTPQPQPQYQQPPQSQPQQPPQPTPPKEVPETKTAKVDEVHQDKSDSETIKPAPPPARSAKPQTHELSQSVEILAKQVSELNVAKDGEPIQHVENKTNRLPGMGGHLLQSNNNRRGGRHRGGAHGSMNNARAPAIPASDFDFETSNAKFHKDELAKEVGKTDDHEEEEEEEVVIPQAEEFYDRSKSFFDNISCETKERMNNSDARNQGGNRLSMPERRAKQSEERQLNLETFGQTSVDQGRFRGGYRGGRGGYRGQRGGYRGGYNQSGGNMYGGRGGYYQNNNRSNGYHHNNQQVQGQGQPQPQPQA